MGLVNTLFIMVKLKDIDMGDSVISPPEHVHIKLLRSIEFVPERSEDRNIKARREKIYKSYEDFLLKNGDKLIDALTDAVKDHLTIDEIKNIEKN
jgi:predicted transcriptional regulator